MQIVNRSYENMAEFNYIVSIALNLAASVVQWSELLATDPKAQVRFPALLEKKSSGSGTGSTQPREYN
jgi:hypothetical protein